MTQPSLTMSSPSVLRSLRDSVSSLGTWLTIRWSVARLVAPTTLFGIVRIHPRRVLSIGKRFDRALGTDTISRRDSVDPKALRHALDVIHDSGANLSEFAFVDASLGKGRAMLCAAEHRFRKIVCLAADPALADTAANNAYVARSKIARCPPMEIVPVEPANALRFLPEKLVVCAIGSDDEPLLRRLREDLEANPRDCWLIVQRHEQQLPDFERVATLRTVRPGFALAVLRFAKRSAGQVDGLAEGGRPDFKQAIRCSIKMLGFVETARWAAGMWLSPVNLNNFRQVAARADREFDRAFGTDTGSVFAEWSGVQPSSGQAVRSHSVPSHTLRHAIARLGELGLAYGEFTFIDLGSGKGRPLLCATEFPFNKVIGVEWSADLARISSANLHKYQPAARKCREAEVVCGDVFSYELPEQPTVFFSWEIFSPETYNRLADRIGESLRKTPRSCWFMFVTRRAYPPPGFARAGFEHVTTVRTCDPFGGGSFFILRAG